MKKVKILTLSTSGFLRKEGMSTMILDFFRFMDPDKLQLEAAAPGGCCPELEREFIQIGVTLHTLPSRKKNVAGYLVALAELLRREHYDALYIHGCSALMGVELALAWACGCKVRVVHCHSTSCDHKKLDRLLRPLFYTFCTDAIACGQDAGKWLFGQRPFRLLQNGRDSQRYRYALDVRERMRASLGLKRTTLAIGHVGNFTENKNQSFVLEVFSQLLQRQPDARLYLMGEGSEKTAVEQKTAELGLADFVVFTGSIPNVPDMLQAMDAMLLPSMHEGLPLVVLEWQMAALPCILSDSITRECAYTDLVTYLPLGNPSAWAEKLLEMAPVDRAALANPVVEKTVDSGFDIRSSAAALEQFFLNRCGEKS